MHGGVGGGGGAFSASASCLYIPFLPLSSLPLPTSPPVDIICLGFLETTNTSSTSSEFILTPGSFHSLLNTYGWCFGEVTHTHTGAAARTVADREQVGGSLCAFAAAWVLFRRPAGIWSNSLESYNLQTEDFIPGRAHFASTAMPCTPPPPLTNMMAASSQPCQM